MMEVPEPAILGANTLHWAAATSPRCRYENQRWHVGAVERWFLSIGGTLQTSEPHRVSATWNRNGENVQATFSYEETVRNVYKTLHVTRNGKRSTIRLLRQIAAEVSRDRVAK